MLLVEDTIVPAASLPLAEFRAHLRMGTGFADDTLQDGLLERHLRAALAAIEARTAKILIARSFSWTLSQWRDRGGQALPVAPLDIVTGVTLIDAAGGETVVAESQWTVTHDAHRPMLLPTGACLPVIPSKGSVRVSFIAGYGPAWSDIPADLAQATLMLAGHFYEYRHSAEGRGVDMPSDIAALVAPYRQMRVMLGGRSQ